MKSKKYISLNLMLCLILALSMVCSSNVVYASSDDVKGIDRRELTVGGATYNFVLYVNNDLQLYVNGRTSFDSVSLYAIVSYKNQKGQSWAKIFGIQTYKNSSGALLKMPSSFYDIQSNCSIYKIEGHCTITKSGKSVQGTIIIS